MVWHRKCDGRVLRTLPKQLSHASPAFRKGAGIISNVASNGMLAA